MKKFSAELGHAVSEATVRNFKRTYISIVKAGSDPDASTELPKNAPGRPLLFDKVGIVDFIEQQLLSSFVLVLFTLSNNFFYIYIYIYIYIYNCIMLKS